MFKKAVFFVSLMATACGSDSDAPFGATGGQGGAAASSGTGGFGAVATGGAAGGGGIAGMAGGAGAPGGSAGVGASAGAGGGAGAPNSQLKFTELMVNPKQTADSAGEYVELYNAGGSSVNLKGYKLSDDFNNSHVINQELTIAPGAYVVLAAVKDLKQNGGVVVDYVYDNFLLANNGDAVLLDDPQGARVAEVRYEAKVPWPVGDGAAIELSSLTADPTQGGSWALAKNRFGTGDLGTPGGPNGYGPTPYKLDAADAGWDDPTLQAGLVFSYFDDPEKAILKALEGAKQSVHIAMFNLRESSIISALGKLKANGVDVQILLDKKQMDLSYNQAKVQEIINAGITPVGVENTAATDATMHDKFTIIDGKRVLTGSANYSSNALTYSDEELLLIDNATVAGLFETEFTELKTGAPNTATAATTPPVQVKFGTDDKLYQVVVDELKAAKSSIHVAMFSINQSSLVNELIAAKQRGVQVMVILDKVQADAGTEDEQLETAGIPVLRFENKRGGAANTGLVEVHNKLCVIDGKKVLMGSYNWTNLASFFNHENMLLLSSRLLAVQAEHEMARMINDYSPSFNPTTVGLSGGTRDVKITVRGFTPDAGTQIYLVGNDASIGENNYALALPFNAAAGGTWEQTVKLPAGTGISYQLVLRSTVRHNYAEPILSREFTVPYAAGTAELHLAYGKTLE
ncbi:MAG: phospholipase D-like domain-containing protein [Polyangiaceae bacterium]